MQKLSKDYWNNRYANDDFPWDIGYVSAPLKSYFDQLTDKSVRILIPGAGSAYEAEYLFHLGFKNVFVIDFADAAIELLKKRMPSFPFSQLISDDFFKHENVYDLIIEQTFFCAIDPVLRQQYADQMAHLLNPGGKLAGLLFDAPLNSDKPPFGGNKEEYISYFAGLFDFVHFELCYNSIAPRTGRELFIELIKK
jgi:SAM-dependent methyltransferase